MGDFDFASDDTLLSITQICKKLGISRSTFDRLRASSLGASAHGGLGLQTRGALARSNNMASGLASMGLPSRTSNDEDDFSGSAPFPKPTVIIGNSPRWSAQTLNEWIRKK